MTTGEVIVALFLGLPTTIAAFTAAYLAIRVNTRVEDVDHKVVEVDAKVVEVDDRVGVVENHVVAIKDEVSPNNGLTSGETQDRTYTALIAIKQTQGLPLTEDEASHLARMKRNEEGGGKAAE